MKNIYNNIVYCIFMLEQFLPFYSVFYWTIKISSSTPQSIELLQSTIPREGEIEYVDNFCPLHFLHNSIHQCVLFYFMNKEVLISLGRRDSWSKIYSQYIYIYSYIFLIPYVFSLSIYALVLVIIKCNKVFFYLSKNIYHTYVNIYHIWRNKDF